MSLSSFCLPNILFLCLLHFLCLRGILNKLPFCSSLSNRFFFLSDSAFSSSSLLLRYLSPVPAFFLLLSSSKANTDLLNSKSSSISYSKFVVSSVVASWEGNAPIVFVMKHILSGNSFSSLSLSNSHSHDSTSLSLGENNFLCLSSAIPYLSFVISWFLVLNYFQCCLSLLFSLVLLRFEPEFHMFVLSSCCLLYL